MPDIWTLAGMAGKLALYVGVLASAGTVFAALVFRLDHYRWIAIAFACLGIIAASLIFSLRGANLTGDASGMIDLEMLGLLWSTPVGTALALRLIGLGVMILGLSSVPSVFGFPYWAEYWHGIRLENSMDGVPMLTQDLINPDDRMTYRFTPPDASTYWYHSQYISHEQVAHGIHLHGHHFFEVRDDDALGDLHDTTRVEAGTRRDIICVFDDLGK